MQFIYQQILPAGAAGTFDVKVNNLRLGQGAAFGAVNVYPRFEFTTKFRKPRLIQIY